MKVLIAKSTNGDMLSMDPFAETLRAEITCMNLLKHCPFIRSKNM